MAEWWLALLLPLALWLLILLLFAGPARAAWCEPVLDNPVLVIESDDWGPGHPGHAEALRRLVDCLGRHRDCAGRAPVMTLGITLSLPDGEAIAAVNFSSYRARTFADPAYADILDAIRTGIRAGVFAPQLHGMAHYWPPALMHAAEHDAAVRAWILDGPHQETETLPSHLQARWCDASALPSRPLADAEIDAAVAEEVAEYEKIFGVPPAVVVPPTFVWTGKVETAWARHGIAGVITPGRRCEGRGADGGPECGGIPIHNGERGAGGVTYLVRDRYFEPARGHRAERGLAALGEKTAQGQPCLLETHRYNFTGAGREVALAELDTLLQGALAAHPNLRFASAAELASQYRGRGDWLAGGRRRRLAAWAARMRALPRFAKLARLTGLDLALAAFAPGERRAAA